MPDCFTAPLSFSSAFNVIAKPCNGCGNPEAGTAQARRHSAPPQGGTERSVVILNSEFNKKSPLYKGESEMRNIFN